MTGCSVRAAALAALLLVLVPFCPSPVEGRHKGNEGLGMPAAKYTPSFETPACLYA